MKTQILLITVILFLSSNTHAQEEIKGNYKIYLDTNGKSANIKVPLILEEEIDTVEVLYSINGNDATKKTKKYRIIDSTFSFQKTNPCFNYSSIIVDLEQKDDKLIIKPKENVLDDFEKFIGKKSRRLYIDISEGVKISKTSWKIGAVTVPLKVYLTDQSDSLKSFTNNVETDVNIAVTFGKSWEKYSFKNGREAKLTNTQYLYTFLALNKLELTEKNTDGRNDGDNILTSSIGFGYQLGYGKLGLSLLLGIDMPFSSIGKNWCFKYQPWLGIGIGYSIFK